ncbi:MAG: IS1595 family transposase [Balneolaceae bacterium]
MIDTKDFKSILELVKTFPDEQTCINHIERLRWNGIVISPFDPTSKVYDCKDNKYKCKNFGKYFNVKTATLFDNTKVSLQTWFIAIYLVTSHSKGISSVQLAKDLDVTQKTAWFMLHRIRNCFGISDDEQLDGTIEVDEGYVGGENKNRSLSKRKELQ